MKTILEFEEEMLEKGASLDKAAVDLFSLPMVLGASTLVGGLGGLAYSHFTEPPERAYEDFQADLMKKKLLDVLEARRNRNRRKKLEEIIDDSRKSIGL